MKASTNPLIASAIARQQLAADFLARHKNDLSGVSAADLESSPIAADREVFAVFGNNANWQDNITNAANTKIPASWLGSTANTGTATATATPPPSHAVRPASVETSGDSWSFGFDVSYLFCLIPYSQGLSTIVVSEALAVINDQITTQPDTVNSAVAGSAYETPRAAAVIGNFDTANASELVLYQATNAINLDTVNISSVTQYQNLYSATTNYFTKSLACNLLNLPNKQQLVTVMISETQIGLDIYYFNNGQKVEWCASQMFNHGINYPNVSGFDACITEVLPNNTVEVTVILSLYLNPQTAWPESFQTNLLKFVIDVSGKSFNLVSNQVLVTFQLGQNFMMGNMEHHIYQQNGYVYFDYFSAANTLAVAAFQWGGTQYSQVWSDTYAMSLQPSWATYQPSLLYRNGNEFYFVHIYQNGDNTSPCYVETYELQTNGSLSKTGSITFSNGSLNPMLNYWAGFYAQGSLYLVQTTFTISGTSLSPTLVYYQVNETAGTVTALSTVPAPAGATGAPVIVMSDYDIVAQPPIMTSLTEAMQAIAILDAPPISSLVTYPGEAYPSLSYQFQQQQSSSQNVQTQTQRTQDDSLGGGISFFGAKIGASIDQSISTSSQQSYGSTYQLTQNTLISCQAQDMTVFLGVTFNIYEYPVSIKGQPAGYFLFVVPASQPNLVVNTGQLMFRNTSHQVGNLLSYPSIAPAEVQQLLYSNEFSVNANENYVLTLGYSDLNTTGSSTTTTTTVTQSLSLSAEFPIISNVAGNISASLKGTYTNTQINTCSFTIENSFQLQVQIPKLQTTDANRYFNITPYFYIDNANILRCSYMVDVPAGGPTDPTFWGQYYVHPEFGMVMPFRTDAFKDDSKYLLSFDISTTPSVPVQNLEQLEISVTVRNWSLVSGSNVVVAFYYGKTFDVNPDPSTLVEIGRQTIALIEPRSAQVATITWQNPVIIQPVDAVPIYVIIDPDNKQTVMGRDYSYAQVNYPLTSLSAVSEVQQVAADEALVES